MLMGFFFVELSVLVKLRIAGLDKLMWPTVAIIAICWIFIIVVGGLSLDPALDFDPAVLKLTFAMNEIALIVQLVVVGWGSSFILFRMIRARHSAPQTPIRGSVVRFAILAFVASSIIFGFGTFWNLWYDTSDYFPIDGTITLFGFQTLIEFSTGFCQNFAALLIAINFTVQIQRSVVKGGFTTALSSGTIRRTHQDTMSPSDNISALEEDPFSPTAAQKQRQAGRGDTEQGVIEL
jgi:hypothetical protein